MQDWGSLALGCLRCTKTCFDSIYWWRCIILDGYHLPSIPISLIRCWNDIEGWDINLPTLRTLFWQPEWLQREFSRIDRSWWQEETVERIEALAAPNDSVADRMGIITGCWAKRLITWEKGFSGWLRKLGVQSPKCPSLFSFGALVLLGPSDSNHDRYEMGKYLKRRNDLVAEKDPTHGDDQRCHGITTNAGAWGWHFSFASYRVAQKLFYLRRFLESLLKTGD